MKNIYLKWCLWQKAYKMACSTCILISWIIKGDELSSTCIPIYRIIKEDGFQDGFKDKGFHGLPSSLLLIVKVVFWSPCWSRSSDTNIGRTFKSQNLKLVNLKTQITSVDLIFTSASVKLVNIKPRLGGSFITNANCIATGWVLRYCCNKIGNCIIACKWVSHLPLLKQWKKIKIACKQGFGSFAPSNIT